MFFSLEVIKLLHVMIISQNNFITLKRVKISILRNSPMTILLTSVEAVALRICSVHLLQHFWNLQEEAELH